AAYLSIMTCARTWAGSPGYWRATSFRSMSTLRSSPDTTRVWLRPEPDSDSSCPVTIPSTSTRASPSVTSVSRVPGSKYPFASRFPHENRCRPTENVSSNVVRAPIRTATLAARRPASISAVTGARDGPRSSVSASLRGGVAVGTLSPSRGTERAAAGRPIMAPAEPSEQAQETCGPLSVAAQSLGATLTLRIAAAAIAPILPERQGQVKPGLGTEGAYRLTLPLKGLRVSANRVSGPLSLRR